MPIDNVLWPGKPATDEQIAELEEIEGVTLPADYRAFLQTYNGGRPIPDAFRFGPDPGSFLNTFFELGEGEGETRDLQTQCDWYCGKIPHTLMPIGCDVGGNPVLLGVHGETKGRVYFLDYMSPRPIFEIAPSFEAFLASFEPSPEVKPVRSGDLDETLTGSPGPVDPVDANSEDAPPGPKVVIDKVLWPGKPATNEQIAEFEEIEGVTLPADYRAFLQTYNGGRPIPDAFRFGAKPGSLLNTFFELDEGEDETNDLQTMCNRYRGRIPWTMMPIGCDAGGNIVLLGVRGKPRGRVYFLDHMNPRPIFELAPSFEAFLASFEPRPEVK